MVKAVFLDRDGTINCDKTYLYKITEFEFLPGVIEALKILQSAGYFLIIITNQSGIARGIYSENDFMILNKWMINELWTKGIFIKDVYYCPHHPKAIIEKYRVNCDCRKPQLGMYMQAIEKYGINLAESFAIGDKIRDCAICETTACRGYLIAENENIQVISDVKNGKYKNIKYKESLLECVKEIVTI